MTALRALPLHPGARGLADDAAVLGTQVLTHDMLVEGVHFLPTDPAGDVAWKLVAVNLSDLAAKGAVPTGVLMGYGLAGDDAWDRAFLAGLAETLTAFACPLLGGDTVVLPKGAPRMLSLTAIGEASVAPARSGARMGDALWVTGTIGDAGAGLAIAQGADGPGELLARYRRPVPRLAEGLALAPLVSAMMDVSDGLLIDASRMAAASGCGVAIELGDVPLSDALRSMPSPTFVSSAVEKSPHSAQSGFSTSLETNGRGEGLSELGTVLAAVTAGDDYELLFALAPGLQPPVPATRIGMFAAGPGLTLTHRGEPVPLPKRLGFEHSA
nr:thiamine-phosphate kinase [Sphingomonas japonica]